MIQASNLVVRRGSEIVLDGISTTARGGELTVIVGSNGAGKSTLLRAVAGDLPAQSGTIHIGPTLVCAQNAEALATTRAILSQATSLSFGFRVFEVVELGRIPHRRNASSSSELRIVGECLERTGVAHLRNRSYPSLSGGEQQRVQLARALAQVWDTPPHERVLILDEPTSSLDLRHQQTTLGLADALAAAGSTVLVVLHDLNLAARYADHCVLMHQGAILAEGSANHVFTPNHLERAFGVRTTILEHPELGCPLIVTLDPRKANEFPCNSVP